VELVSEEDNPHHQRLNQDMINVKADYCFVSFPLHRSGVDVMHNFLRFLTIFGEKIGAFLKNQCYDPNFA
jgi:hypothetical protein